MAVSNISGKEKTINSMFSLLSSDNYTIDKTLLYYNYKNENIIAFETILDGYRDYFDNLCVDVDVPEKFYYQPAAFAENYYGTPDLDFLVLYFAKMTTLFEFTKSKIKALPKSQIVEINKLFVEYKQTIDDSYKNPEEYIKTDSRVSRLS